MSRGRSPGRRWPASARGLRFWPGRGAWLGMLLLAASGAMGQEALTENTRRSEEGAARPPATIADAAWLAGDWHGSGLGGAVEEMWTEPSGGTMVGTFKLLQDGQPAFYEIFVLMENEGSLELRLKHFHADMRGWEEKDDYVTFRLVAREEDALYFGGLTYRRVDDRRLRVFLAMRRGGETSEVSFEFERR